jgi:hypothetical protein
VIPVRGEVAWPELCQQSEDRAAAMDCKSTDRRGGVGVVGASDIATGD